MQRRDLLKNGVIAGALLALPARGLAEALAGTASRPVEGLPMPPVPVGSLPVAGLPVAGAAAQAVPAAPAGLTFYERRVLDVAAREKSRVAASLWRTDIVGIADFGQPSSVARLHFANLEAGTVRSFLVAHGRGSDPDHDGWLNSFSNSVGSEATSRGAYLSCEWYSGKYGTSIRMLGLDGDNSNALDRAIVMHPAWYVDEAMVARQGKIGRSEGCFAMAPNQFNEALWHLSGGRLLFADRIAMF